jgi:hypothetical protein
MNTFDDAFITFRHSVNLALGRGFVFNAGDNVLGTTSPLFGLILTLPALFGVQPTIFSIALGMTCDVLVAILAFSLLERDIGIAAALGFLTFFAINPHVIRVSVGGMESTLFLLLSFSTARLLARRDEGWALVLSAISVWIRPEGAAWGLLALAALWLRGGSRSRLRFTVVAAALVAFPMVLMWLQYGSLLPQSVESKGKFVGGSLGEVVAIFFFPEGSPVQSALTLLGLIGLFKAWRASTTMRWYLIWSGMYVAAYMLARPRMMTWYALPVYFAVTTLAGIAAGMMLERLPGGRLRRDLVGWGVAGVCALAAIGLVASTGSSPVRRNVYEPLAAWCRENLSPGQTVAAGDVGAIGYYSEAIIYDLAGLVWRDRWQYDTARDVVLGRKPDFIFAEVSQYWRELYEPSSDLRKLYRPVKRFSRFGETSTEPSREHLARSWIQDYVMFERIPTTAKP